MTVNMGQQPRRHQPRLGEMDGLTAAAHLRASASHSLRGRRPDSCSLRFALAAVASDSANARAKSSSSAVRGRASSSFPREKVMRCVESRVSNDWMQSSGGEPPHSFHGLQRCLILLKPRLPKFQMRPPKMAPIIAWPASTVCRDNPARDAAAVPILQLHLVR